MKTSMRLAAICFIALIAVSAFAGAADKSVDSEARKYILRGESATYFILNASDGNIYYVVQIDDKNSLVFNEKVDVITDEAKLVNILRDYYLESGATGFTEATKLDLINTFNESEVLFTKCHYNFYNYVESNFFWAQYRCIDAATGTVCDKAFAQRKKMKDAWDVLHEKVELLKVADSTGATGDALSQIYGAATDAKNETVNFDDAGIGYRYFLGETMDKDPVCGFRYDLMDRVIELSGPAYQNKITDINTEAKEMIKIYNLRKDVMRIKEVQTLGREVLEKAINKTTVVPVKFTPIDSKLKEIENDYEVLKNATTIDSATNYLNAMNLKYAALETLIDDPAGLLFSYNKTRTADSEARAAIDAAIEKYTETDTRVMGLKNEFAQAGIELDQIDKKLTNGTEVTVAELQAMETKYESIRRRAAGLPSPQNELDLTTIVAIVVVVATIIGVLIYVLKFRKKGGGGGFHYKEVDIKTVMGSGTEKRHLEKEKVDTEQHRKAMFPKL
ncbi:MAG: hypothetical protein ABH863_03405 [Candidatus Micrarchaeota archaeon]